MAYILESEPEPDHSPALNAFIFTVLGACALVHWLSDWHALLSAYTFFNGLSYFILFIYAFIHIGIYVHTRFNSISSVALNLDEIKKYSKYLLIPCFVISLSAFDLLVYRDSTVVSQEVSVTGVTCGKKINYGQITNCFKLPGFGKIKINNPQLKYMKSGEQKTATLQFRKSTLLPGVTYLKTN